VGDPQQLSATVFAKATPRRSPEPNGNGESYSRSLFERLVAVGQPVHLLDTQYRMHPEISNHASQLFYEGQLQDSPTVCGAAWQKKFHAAGFAPFLFFDLDASAEVRGDGAGMSVKNPEEAKLVSNIYRTIREVCAENDELPKTPGPWAAVITPYTEQLFELKRRFEYAGWSGEVELNTVDAFQGQEQDVVILSTVRAGAGGRIGFLSDARRLNVAMTRAKYGCYLVGRRRTLEKDPSWGALLRRAESVGAVVAVSGPEVRQLLAIHVDARHHLWAA
jgi:senataxin